MDWNRALLTGAQCVVFVTFAVLVGLGHDSAINDVLLAVGGSLAGTGAYQVIKGKSTTTSTK
jgi:hypothetical protein